MTQKYTPIYRIPYCDGDEPARNWPAIGEAVANRIEQAFKDAQIPPGDPSQNAVLARLASLEGGPWTKLALKNAWAEYVGGGGYRTGLWCRKSGGNVQITGMVRAGAVGTVIGVLPADLRPAYAAMYPAVAAAQNCAVFINPDGEVSYLFGPAAPGYLNITLLVPLT